jgi:hypothetical protein
MIIGKISFAQYNLVPNPSLEVTQPNDSCLFLPGTIEYVKPWSDITGGTVYYSFDSCSYYPGLRIPYTAYGFQTPHSGKSFGSFGTYTDTSLGPAGGGFGSYSRNFPFVKLKKTLMNNHVYVVDFYLNLPDSAYNACSNIGAYFSADSLDYTQINLSNQNIFPQVENNPIVNPLTSQTDWTLVHGCFTANGTENYITIGNFVSQHLCDTVQITNILYRNTAYFLDDVSVIELRANAFADDTIICSNNGFTKKLRVYDGMHNILWSTGDTTQSIIVSVPPGGVGGGFTYWVTATNECGTVTDTINIYLHNPNDYLFNLGNDTNICKGAIKQLTISNPNVYNYLWSTGDTTQSITFSLPPGGVGGGYTYWATAQSECGLQTDSIIIGLRNPNNYVFNLGNDDLICKSASKKLTISNPKLYNYLWSTGDTSKSITFTLPPGGAGGGYTYWATALSECGTVSDTVIITEIAIPNLITQTDTTIYVGDTITITAIDGLEQYEWSSGEITNSILFSASSLLGRVGVGLIAYTQDGCLATDSITIKTIAKPVLELQIIIPNPQIIGKGGTFKILNLPPNNSVMLYDAMGQIVFKETNYTNNFSLDFIAEGIYFYKIVLPTDIIINGKLLILEK